MSETTEPTDADRLRYVAEHPEVLRVLYDLFGERGLRPGHDPLDAMRDVLDEEMTRVPTGEEHEE